MTFSVLTLFPVKGKSLTRLEVGGPCGASHRPPDTNNRPKEARTMSTQSADEIYKDRSYFADLLEVATDERMAARAFESGEVQMKGDDVLATPTGAKARILKAAEQDARNERLGNLYGQFSDVLKSTSGRPRADLSTTATEGGEFVPSGAPTRVQEAFAGAVRARAVVAPLLQNIPLPPTGQTVEEPRITTGPSVAMHTENAAASETDLVTELEDVPVRTIAGQVDLSRAAFDRSTPALDQVIATELGTAYAELLEQQILNGAGSGQDLTGLLNVSGITSVAYTDGTPTVAEMWPKLMEAISTTSSAWKNTTPVVLFHLRRLAWIFSSLGNTPTPPPGVSFVASGGIPTTLGAGTNEDAAIVLDPQAIRLHSTRPRIRVFVETGAANATVKVQAYGYVALNSARHPEAIGKLTGTGMASPSFA